MNRLFPGSHARRLEDALEGLEFLSDMEPLVALAAELRATGLATPTEAPSAAAREQLRAAVVSVAANTKQRGVAARVRGATFAVAAIAGGGLVIASAASGSNPAVLVADAARELPGIGRLSAPPSSVALEGEVVASRDAGTTLEVRVGDETVTVESPKESRAVVAGGTPVAAADIQQGATVRVTASRDSDTSVVTAKKIEVLSPAATSTSRPSAATAVTPLAVAEPTRDVRPALANATPSPSATQKTPPTALAATDPATTSNVSAADPVAPTHTPTRGPSPSPIPTPRPAAKPTGVAANETTSMEMGTGVDSASSDSAR